MSTTVADTDTGTERSVNEDSVLEITLPDGNPLIAVADGMGGHNAGDVASESALTEFSTYLRQQPPDRSVDRLLKDAIEHANNELAKMAEENPEFEGMGTTLVGALVIDGEAVIANVGDSRAYLLNDDQIEQITTDHSLVQELVEAGQIEPEEASDHPNQNVITQSLGPTEDIDPDIFRVRVSGRLLLCSDGLIRELSDDRISTLNQNCETIDELGTKLMSAAMEGTCDDNVSIALAE